MIYFIRKDILKNYDLMFQFGRAKVELDLFGSNLKSSIPEHFDPITFIHLGTYS
jgi:hypothetical protein